MSQNLSYLKISWALFIPKNQDFPLIIAIVLHAGTWALEFLSFFISNLHFITP